MPRGEKLFGELCEHFNLYPYIEFREQEQSTYYGEERLIVIGTEDGSGIKANIVHEFAHVLDFARRRAGFSYHHHDRNYYKYLLEVINFAYKNPKYYPWKFEYEPIKKFAREDGYLSKIKEDTQ